MPITSLTAKKLISLGKYVTALFAPPHYDHANYLDSVTQFLALAEKCNFRHAISVAEPLQAQLNGMADTTTYTTARNHFVSTAASIDHVLNCEASSTTAILTDVEPPQSLRQLTLPEPHQQALQSDLITCLKVHLARPAIVMAWALGYDLVRSWVFDDSGRLAAFNQQLTKNPRKGEPIAVVVYSDFFHIGEWRFLEVCRDSQDTKLRDFDDKTVRGLQGLLDQRNEFAHANYAMATVTEATAYVERMVRIVTGRPFV
jgi:hypothetical protein